MPGHIPNGQVGEVACMQKGPIPYLRQSEAQERADDQAHELKIATKLMEQKFVQTLIY